MEKRGEESGDGCRIEESGDGYRREESGYRREERRGEERRGEWRWRMIEKINFKCFTNYNFKSCTPLNYDMYTIQCIVYIV